MVTKLPYSESVSKIDIIRRINQLIDADSVASLSANGYIKLPCGLIIQWGKVNNDGTGQVSVTFPTAFPNACFGVVQMDTVSTSTTHTTYLNSSPTTTGFTVEWRQGSGALNTDTGITTYWIAIGY